MRACAALRLCVGLFLGIATAGTQAEDEKIAVEVSTVGELDLTSRLTANIRAHISLSGEPCDTPDWRVQRLFRQIDEEVQRGARALGHYHPEIEKRLDQKGECPHAKVTVTPGPTVQMQAVDVELRGPANDDPAFAELLANLPLNPGDPLRHDSYEAIKKRLRGLAAERGYFDASLCGAELRVDPASNRATAKLCLDSASRYHIGDVDFAQQILDDSILASYLTFKAGDAYNSRTLNESYRNLADSGYFERVDVRPHIDERGDGQVPVEILLDPRPRHGYEVRLGYATDSGPRLSAGYENRFVNRRGHRWGADLSLSTVLSNLSAEYEIPLRRAPWRKLTLGAGYRYEESDNQAIQGVDITAHANRSRGKWNEIWSLDLLYEKSDVTIPEDWSALVIPGIAWDRVRSDDPIRPHRGRKFRLELKAAHDDLLSDVSLLRAYGAVKLLEPLGDGKVLARGELGALWSDDFHELPGSLRFFTGGDQTVRGYGYKDLGPRNAEGDNIGGRYLTVFSLEYEHPVSADWGAAIFADTGNAYDDLSEDLKSGVGAGARWYSPIGPFRLDVAVPVDDPDNSFRVHISLGTLF